MVRVSIYPKARSNSLPPCPTLPYTPNFPIQGSGWGEQRHPISDVLGRDGQSWALNGCKPLMTVSLTKYLSQPREHPVEAARTCLRSLILPSNPIAWTSSVTPSRQTARLRHTLHIIKSLKYFNALITHHSSPNSSRSGTPWEIKHGTQREIKHLTKKKKKYIYIYILYIYTSDQMLSRVRLFATP